MYCTYLIVDLVESCRFSIVPLNCPIQIGLSGVLDDQAVLTEVPTCLGDNGSVMRRHVQHVGWCPPCVGRCAELLLTVTGLEITWILLVSLCEEFSPQTMFCWLLEANNPKGKLPKCLYTSL